MADIVCTGYACVDVYFRGLDTKTLFKEELSTCESTMLAVGGDAANEAIVMSRLGEDVALVSGIGTDGAGDFIRDTVAAAGVDITYLRRSDTSGSPLTGVIVLPDGQRNFISISGYPDCTLFEPDPACFRGAKIVSLASIFTAPLTDPERIRRVVRVAKEEGCVVCADVVVCNEAGSLDSIRESLADVDYIFPNQEEAEFLTEKTGLSEMADTFLGAGVKNVIIKTGKDGCYIKNADGEMRVPSIGPGVIDTTGAGDNFAAGFITALNRGKSLAECAEFASGTAGVACQSVGSNTGVKSMEQVREFIGKYRV